MILSCGLELAMGGVDRDELVAEEAEEVEEQEE